MYRCDRGQRSRINFVHNAMNALQKIPDTGDGSGFFQFLSTVIEFAQIGPGAEPRFDRAIEDECVRFRLKFLQGSRKPFQLFERERADLIAGTTMQRQFDDARFQLPR